MQIGYFKPLATVMLLTWSAFRTLSQPYYIRGEVIDASDKTALPGATVMVTAANDKTVSNGTVSDNNGRFEVSINETGAFIIKVNYLGYKTLTRDINVTATNDSAYVLQLERDRTTLATVTIRDQQLRVEQMGDTSQYNASAFKVNPDATAEDLLKKMPGITSDNQGLKMNGEDIKKVLVDGKPFFGDDPNAAIRNLPAEIVDKIQVFDNQSDQARFTGFRDASTDKALNIITKNGKNVGQFGKVYGGYGTDERYQAGGNFNIFNGDRRLSIIGLSNNINQQNFSVSDIISVMSNTDGGAGMPGGPPPDRSVGGDARSGSRTANSAGRPPLLVGQQSGITGTQSLGLNFTDTWGKRLSVSGSYFFNYTDNSNQSTVRRTYYSDALLYNEDGDKDTRNVNHRANIKLEYKLDSFNTLTMTPSVTFQGNRYTNSLAAQNLRNTNVTGATNSFDSAGTTGYSLANTFLFQHKFRKPRRTISLNATAQINEKDGLGRYSSSSRYEGSTAATLLDQSYTISNFDQTYGATLSYTEPVGRKGQLMYNYSPSITIGRADKQTNNLDVGTDTYSLLDTTLSNKYDNNYITQKTGLAYRIQIGAGNLSVGADYQLASLRGNQQFPVSFNTDRTFYSVLPSLNFDRRIGRSQSLLFSYRATTTSPSLSDLQSVLNMSNPLQVTAGNPDLNQTYSHSLMGRYSKSNPTKARNFFVFMSASYASDAIANAIYAPLSDTIIQGFAVSKGSQLTVPVNLDGSVSAKTFAVYSLPVKPVKSNLSLNAGLNYSRTPSLINEIPNYTNSTAASGGFTLGSNISTSLDFTLSYTGNYNFVKSSLQATTNNNYYSHNATYKLNYILLKSLVLSTDVTHTLYQGLSASYNQSYFVWNAAVGYKFLKTKALEVKLSVFDLLKQNRSITRTVAETYVQDNSNIALRRYGMLTATYTIRNFKNGQAPANKLDLPPGLPPPPLGN